MFTSSGRTCFGRYVRSSGRAAGLALAVALLLSGPGLCDGDVAIQLSVNPDVVVNPGGVLTIEWAVDPGSTTPARVFYCIFDPPRTTMIEQQEYPGATGLAVTRQWVVPAAPQLPDGIYWVRIEYWAQGVGLEAIAEANFEVETQTAVEPETWGRIKELFRPGR